jgi:hypothetical protein
LRQARIIKSDIKINVPIKEQHYPTTTSLELSSCLAYIPETLWSGAMFVCKSSQVKVASIGQAIVQAVRPGAGLAPLEVGLSVHKYHSSFLVSTLYQMGVSFLLQ